MTIEWNKVTSLSQIVALVLFIGVFCLGYWLGTVHEDHAFTNGLKAGVGMSPADTASEKVIAKATYLCDASKNIQAIYRESNVDLILSDGRHFALPHALSADGARYANKDESIVFWNKGNTAFITEGKNTTFENCVSKPIPE